MTDNQHRDLIESMNHELLRTLSRLPPTPLIERYGRAIAAIQQEVGLSPTGLRSIMLCAPADADLAAIGTHRCAELRKWVTKYPWYAFSLVIGLAQNDENLAWGLAYG